MATVIQVLPVPDPTSTPSADWGRSLATVLNSVAGNRFQIAAGKVTVKLTESVSETLGKYSRGHARVDFPPGLFSSGPVVALCGNSLYPGTMIEATFTGISHTGMTVYVARSDKTSTVVNWVAVQSGGATDSGVND